MKCQICEGSGEVSSEENKMLTESFELLEELITAIGDDGEISVPEFIKIQQAFQEFMLAYRKLLKSKRNNETKL